MEKLFELSYSLHDKLLETDEYHKLQEATKKMFDNKESKRKIDDYNKMMEIYSNNKSNDNQKRLHEAKLVMDNDLLVIEYKKAYKNYQLLLSNITSICFDGFSEESLFDKIIKG